MKRIFSLILAVAIFICIPGVPQVSAATSDYMEIYGLHLSESGDSTLLNLSGEWLLVDTGASDCSSELMAYLEKYGVEELDIYISHLHFDHYGGVEAIGLCEDITVGTIYLPDPSIGAEYEHQQYFLDKLYEDSGAEERVYLKKGSRISGYSGCEIEVLGPVGEYTVDQFSYKAEEGSDGDVSDYLNNYSLTTKFTCGEVSFITTGDIEAEEEDALVKYYADGELDADILKMAHHGLNTSNTPQFLAAVSPDYSYALSTGYHTYTSRKNASNYGVVYMVGDEKANLCLKVDGRSVKAYKGDTELTGWVSLLGGYGNDGRYNKYYITGGKSLKGIQTVDGKKYHFGTGGCMITGSYGDDGAYSPWRNMEDGTRAFAEDGEMYVGFKKIGDNTFYFDPASGLRIVGDEAWKLVSIGGSYYALSQKGAVKLNGWLSYTVDGGKKYRYFDASGKMKTGWFTLNGKKYYLDPATGYRTVGLKKIGGKYYYFEETNSAAYLRTACWKKFDSKYRYFGTDGVMKTGWTKVDGKYYYLDKSTGYSYTKTGVRTIDGKKYYMQKASKGSYRYNEKGWKTHDGKKRYFASGGVITTGWKKISGKYRYFSSSGVLTTGWKKIDGKYYYFNKSSGSVYTKTGLTTIDGKKYYMKKSSKGSYRYNKKGWKKFGKKYRYFQKNGVVTTGWKKIGKSKYYFDKNGYRVTGTKKINGKKYKFDKNGKLKK